MGENDLKQRTKTFALDVIKVVESLPVSSVKTARKGSR
jgi:hypothetical protein